MTSMTSAHKILLADLKEWARKKNITTGTILAERGSIWVEFTFDDPNNRAPHRPFLNTRLQPSGKLS